MNWAIQTILFLLGLAVGSFLNVFILRYDPSQKFFSFRRTLGRSQCPGCSKTLAWYELVPLLSYFLQRGKCRSCETSLSLQYPLVELLSGVAFVFVPLRIEQLLLLSPFFANIWVIAGLSAIWIAVALLLVAVFLVDVRYFIIPNSVNAALAALGAIWTVALLLVRFPAGMGAGSFLFNFAPLFPIFSTVWANHLLGLGVGFVLFLIIVLASLGKGMGMGDVKLIASLGLLFGWPDIMVVMLVSFILGAVLAVWSLLIGKKKMSDQIPFGPIIVIAAGLVFFGGAGLASLYLGIL